MGLHMVALVKIHLQISCHCLTPIMAIAACPLALKLLLGLRLFREAYSDTLYASRLFFFRLVRIAFNNDEPLSNGARLQRALRLICRTIANQRRAPQSEELVQDTFNALSVLAL